MPHVAIKKRRAEFQVRIFAADQIEIDLAEPEQVKVIDEESAEKNNQQTHPVEAIDDELGDSSVDVPDDAADGAPLPEEQQQGEAGE
jgi:hypothetical protein